MFKAVLDQTNKELKHTFDHMEGEEGVQGINKRMDLQYFQGRQLTGMHLLEWGYFTTTSQQSTKQNPHQQNTDRATWKISINRILTTPLGRATRVPGRERACSQIFIFKNILEQANEYNAIMYIHFVRKHSNRYTETA